MPPDEPERATRPLADVAGLIRSLTEAGRLKLRKIARLYALACSLEADDLLQTAFASALAGDRHCPAQVDIVRFLAEIMRSMASDSTKMVRRQTEARVKRGWVRQMPLGGEGGADPLVRSSPTPEGLLADEQQAARIKKTILSLFDDDPVAQTIIECDMEEMGGEDKRITAGLTKKTYESKRRFIRRRIDRAFPKGWKS
jgi:DNA-directed RNA polymerase specialized sigma24 family protein